MPRVLRIINRFNLGGPTHNAGYLSRYLPADYETLLVGGSEESGEESSGHILRSMGLEPLVLPEMQREVAPWRDRTAYRRIKQLIREFKPDIVHTHAAKAGAVGRMAAADLGVKAVVHTFHGHVFHSYFGPLRTAVYKNVERYLARRSHAIVAISDRQKNELVTEHRICPAEKVTVVPLGFDLSKFQDDRPAKRALFRQVYGLEEDEVAVGIIGRLVPVKNHALFLEVARSVVGNSDRKVRFFIVGDGEEREYLGALVHQLGLQAVQGPNFHGSGLAHGAGSGPRVERATVTFTSWLKEVDVVNAGLDIVMLTSLNEGTPVSLIEAQAANRPVLSTRVGGVENVVQEGRTGILCPSGDAQALSAGLLRMVEDERLRERMGAGGWDHVRERYHYSRLIADMDALYRRLLG